MVIPFGLLDWPALFRELPNIFTKLRPIVPFGELITTRLEFGTVFDRAQSGVRLHCKKNVIECIAVVKYTTVCVSAVEFINSRPNTVNGVVYLTTTMHSVTFLFSM